jgi:hypothetical protein
VLQFPPEWIRQPLRCKHCRTVFRAKADPLPPGTPLPPPVVPGPPPALTADPPGTASPIRILPPGPPTLARRPAVELLVALGAVVGVTALYALAAWDGLPPPNSPLGYGLAGTGFLMMLSTETLYSLRKRLRGFTWGRMSTWLRIHIVTGIVGPYLVLLHSGGRFHGLAGVLSLLTIVLVASGFVGRYLYTAVPRRLDGAEVAVRELDGQIAQINRDLEALGAAAPAVGALAAATEVPRPGWWLVLGRGWLRRRQQRALRRALKALDTAGRARAAPLENLLAARYRLQLQISALAVARRLLALWRAVHLPLSGIVFTLAFLHVGAALYYAAGLK